MPVSHASAQDEFGSTWQHKVLLKRGHMNINSVTNRPYPRTMRFEIKGLEVITAAASANYNLSTVPSPMPHC